MRTGKIAYAGVIGAVAGFVGIMGLPSWFTDGSGVIEGTADVSGKLAFAMSVATFAFGGAYILLSDPPVRRAMGALVSLCAAVMTLACLWGQQRADLLLAGGQSDTGLVLSAMGGLLGICAGLLSLQASMKADEEQRAALAAA